MANNTYIRKRGGTIDFTSRSGHLYSEVKDNVLPPSDKPDRVITEEPIVDTVTEDDMASLLTSSEMETPKFIEIAKASYAKAKALENRIDVVQSIVLEDPINIKLDEPYAKLCRNLIGTDVIDNNSVKCLTRLANFNEYEYQKENIDISDPFKKQKAALQEAYSEEKLKDAFPDFGIDLILLIAFMIPRFINIIIHQQLCKITKVIFDGGIPVFPGMEKAMKDWLPGWAMNGSTEDNLKEWKQKFEDEESALEKLKLLKVLFGIILCVKIPLPKFSDLLCKMWNISANTSNATIGASLVPSFITHSFVFMVNKMYSYPFLKPGTPLTSVKKKKNIKEESAYYLEYVDAVIKGAFNNKFEINVCDENYKYEFTTELYSYYAGLHPATSPIDGDNPNSPTRCSYDYTPTAVESTIAREILTKAIEKENNQTSDSYRDINTKHALTSYTMLDRMKNDARSISVSMNGIEEKLYTKNGNYVADKVDIHILGFFAVLNGNLQRMDKAVTSVLALEFLSGEARQWLCCLIRFIYLILPRMGVEGVTLTTKDFDQFNLDSSNANEFMDEKVKAFMEDAKVWVKILDSFLGVLGSNNSIAMEFPSFPSSITDMFYGAFKKGIAEGSSILTTALYKKLNEGMFKVFDGLNDVPDIRLAMESCPPFMHLMLKLRCGMEAFFAKLQSIIAELWMDGEDMMNKFDFMISIQSNNADIKLFRDLLQMILKWDMALINFCALKKTASEAEKEKLLERLIDSTESPITKKLFSEDFAEKIANSVSIYSDSTSLSPATSVDKKYSNSFIYESARNKLVNYYEGIKQDNTEDITLAAQGFDKPAFLTEVPTNETWEPQMLVKSCGNEMKALLEFRLNDIEEIHRAVRNGNGQSTIPAPITQDTTNQVNDSDIMNVVNDMNI